MVPAESTERVHRVLAAAEGPFRSRGRRRFRYDEEKWYRALGVMPDLTDEERRLVVAFLTRTKVKNEQDATWLRGSGYSGAAAALGGVLALDGAWRALPVAALLFLSTYLVGKTVETHEPAVAYAEALLAALAATPRPPGDSS